MSLGFNAISSGSYTAALGPSATASNTDARAIGASAIASGDHSTALSTQSNATGEYSIAITFVNLDNLRNVEPGLTKDQMYDLLGTPHFHEWFVGAHVWNYLFDFRRGERS